MLGQGCFSTSRPPSPAATFLPSWLTTSGTTPKNGRPVEPGLVACAPGRVVSMIAPVSVCHQVSTIGQRFLPTCSRYHIHASGLIGSPTLPSRRRLDRSDLAGHSLPARMKARIAVGAVYSTVTRCFSISCQKRPQSGWFGAPSYNRQVAPLESGPYTRELWPVIQPTSAVHQ